jgi:hypothetical protein
MAASDRGCPSSAAAERCGPAAPSPALQAALDRIEEEFGVAAFHRSRKRRVRRLFAAGPADPEVRLRHAWLAYAARERGIDLDAALILLARCARANARHDRAVRLWADSFRLINRDTIFALRLALRWLRRRAPARFPEILDAMTAPGWRDAAE